MNFIFLSAAREESIRTWYSIQKGGIQDGWVGMCNTQVLWLHRTPVHSGSFVSFCCLPLLTPFRISLYSMCNSLRDEGRSDGKLGRDTERSHSNECATGSSCKFHFDLGLRIDGLGRGLGITNFCTFLSLGRGTCLPRIL